MNTNVAYSLLGRISNEPMLLSPTFVGLGSAIREMAAAERAGSDPMKAHLSEVCAAYGGAIHAEKIYGMVGSLALIPVHGALINRFSGAWGYVTGYNYIHAAMQSAMSDPSVDGIVLDVNSYGGEAQGCMELSQAIYEMRGEKPIVAIVDANSYSAGYALACAADRVVVTPSGGAGSIGVVTMHVDFSKALSDMGIKVTFIFAGEHKVDGNSYEPLPKEVKADIQSRVSAAYDRFVSLVAQNRGLDEGAVRATEARIYTAADALKVGLIDAVAPPPEAIAAFLSELTGSNNQEGSEMSNQKGQPGATDTPEQKAAAEAAAAAAAQKADDAAAQKAEEDAAAQKKADEEAAATAAAATPAPQTAERQRVKAILSCDEANGKSALANHLAFETELSVEQAQAMLKAAAPETAGAPSPLEAAMAATGGGAGVDAGDGDGGATGTGDQTASQKILQTYAKATGLKFETK